MTYSVARDAVSDSWSRGKIEMFARLVEVRNKHPEWVDDAAINELYNDVSDYCGIKTNMSVYTLADGEEITE